MATCFSGDPHVTRHSAAGAQIFRPNNCGRTDRSDRESRGVECTTIGLYRPEIAAGVTAVRKDTLRRAGEKGHISIGMIDAILKVNADESAFYDPRLGCKKYYQIQSNQGLGCHRVEVPIFIDSGSLDSSWLSPVRDAMKAINEAAPGIHMYEVATDSTAKILIHHDAQEGGAFTRGDIINSAGLTEISLERSWIRKRGTAIHELMHAVGLEHEHKRKDAEKFMACDVSGLGSRWTPQYQAKSDILCLTRFDPHSVMIYDLNDCLKRKPESDVVWKTKAGDEQCQVLSELDKVGLNILYRPVPHDGYKPSQNVSVSGLFYCGRPVFSDSEEDVIKQALTDKRCGPNNWANCAACRVLKTTKSEAVKALGKWQGWTGLVYCGRYFGKVNSNHDGYCGPDNGPPCKECGRLLHPGYAGDWYGRNGDDCAIL